MKNKLSLLIGGLLVFFALLSCSVTKSMGLQSHQANANVPENFQANTLVDSTDSFKVDWRSVFNDENLTKLIDSALLNNQELNIALQEMLSSKAEIRAKRGEYLPNAGVRLGAGVERVGEYTRNGAVESQLFVKEGEHFPHPLGDFMVNGYFKWEIDIWNRLRNSKKAAVIRYYASVEGRNFMQTQLVSEIAHRYYELLALDNELDIVKKNIQIQSDALKVVVQQKDAGRVTQLAVNRFEAQLYNTQSLQYSIEQQIIEAENELNLLAGRYPQKVQRNSSLFMDSELAQIYVSAPSSLLANRADIRQAEFQLKASQLDVRVAKASFLPQFSINANIGFNAFKPSVWFNPSSLLYNLLGDLMMPLLNRNQLKANYMLANASQNQAAYNYERSVLLAYVEVSTQMANIKNTTLGFELKQNEVDLLNQSVQISNSLFSSARADYMEVLMTQKETIESTLDLIDLKLQQMHAKIDLFRALGGGWK